MINPKLVFEPALLRDIGYKYFSGTFRKCQAHLNRQGPRNPRGRKSFLSETTKSKNVDFVCGEGIEKLQELIEHYGESSLIFASSSMLTKKTTTPTTNWR